MTLDLIGPVNAEPMIKWISGIPFEKWPQQHRLDDGQIRPAMVTDLGWFGFGELASHLREQLGHLGKTYQNMLSVVMPRHSIAPHTDSQDASWKYRVHIPLLSNAESKFIVDDVAYTMNPGMAYRVNTRVIHSVENNGKTPRIHFMFDVGD